MFVRKMLARALPLTALGLAAWCPAYAVEEPVKADDVYVTATRVEKELQDVPMSVSVMTGEDIKRSPARTIGELLQDVPGVEIRNSGGQGFKRISIRGENPNRVLILIDGQKLVENKSMDGTPLLIDPSNVDAWKSSRAPRPCSTVRKPSAAWSTSSPRKAGTNRFRARRPWPITARPTVLPNPCRLSAG